MNDHENENSFEEPSEEDFAAEPIKKPRGILYEQLDSKYAFSSVAIGVLCIVFSLVFWFSDQFRDLLWVSRISVFDQHEYWRVITAIFTHADVGHLLSNLPLLMIFGWLLRGYFGFVAFPLASLVVAILTNVATLFFYPETVRLIGASGMVYGVGALWITFYLRYEIRYSFSKRLLRAIGVFLILLFPSAYNPTTSYLAHIFGFLFGIIFAIALMTTGIYDRRQRRLQS